MRGISDFLVDNMMVIIPNEKIAVFMVLMVFFLLFYLFVKLLRASLKNRRILKETLKEIIRKEQLGDKYFMVSKDFGFLAGSGKTVTLTVIDLKAVNRCMVEGTDITENGKKIMLGVKNFIIVTKKDCLERLIKIKSDFFGKIIQNSCQIFFYCPALDGRINDFAKENNLEVVTKVPEPNDELRLKIVV